MKEDFLNSTLGMLKDQIDSGLLNGLDQIKKEISNLKNELPQKNREGKSVFVNLCYL